jgi:hypothetical protein
MPAIIPGKAECFVSADYFKIYQTGLNVFPIFALIIINKVYLKSKWIFLFS